MINYDEVFQVWQFNLSFLSCLNLDETDGMINYDESSKFGSSTYLFRVGKTPALTIILNHLIRLIMVQTIASTCKINLATHLIA